MNTSPLDEIREYFGADKDSFRKEWAELTMEDKKDLLRGIRNGSLTY